MLLGITLKNFAIIEDLSVSFDKGLNIITGETGTGKSIIVDAINIILGDRPSDAVKSGKEEAHIEALFDISNNCPIQERLASHGFEAKGGEFLIKRIVPRNGRNRVFINGSFATFQILEKLTDGLVDIFSQHEHQSLLKEGTHLDVLDEFGGLHPLTEDFKDVYDRLSEAKSELEELEEKKTKQIEREDFLRFQLREIEAAGLKPDEDVELNTERVRLSNSERLYSVTQGAYESLYENEGSVFDMLKIIQDEIEQAEGIDSSLCGIGETLRKISVEVQDSASLLRDYASDISFDTDRLNYVESRLQEIGKIKRKYGESVRDILARRDELAEELYEIGGVEERMEALAGQVRSLESEAQSLAGEISKKRQEAAERLVETVEKGLSEVGISGGKFVVDISRKDLSKNGFDRVSFLFSANPDEEPKPLTKVASGGELSRIMLVLKEIIARVEGGSILIFDEADSGIGGAVAETVGKKIKNLSNNYQVICITHLPQVAKFADTHRKVTKTFENNSTKVRVEALDRDQRVGEIARMLGGIEVTEKTVEAAREMLRE